MSGDRWPPPLGGGREPPVNTGYCGSMRVSGRYLSLQTYTRRPITCRSAVGSQGGRQAAPAVGGARRCRRCATARTTGARARGARATRTPRVDCGARASTTWSASRRCAAPSAAAGCRPDARGYRTADVSEWHAP